MQGREKDIVIFSAVRSSQHRKGKIGFVADERRVNVALTRARASLLVVANFKVLQRDHHWSNLVKHATASKCAASHAHTPGTANPCSIVEHHIFPHLNQARLQDIKGTASTK